MSDPQKTAEATTQDNHMPAPPVEEPVTVPEEPVTVTAPDGPVAETITTMDNHMPVPPALGGDGA